jgi:hypothetical protein
VQDRLDLIVSKDLCRFTPPTPKLMFDKTTQRSRLVPGTASYWISKQASAEILQEVVQDPSRGLATIRRGLSKIGTEILGTKGKGVSVSETIEKWATLAAKATEPETVRHFLLDEVDKQLKQGRLGEALRWVEAAMPLEEQIKGQLTEAVRLASPRIALFQSLANDEKYLGRFLERPGQIQAFRDLPRGMTITGRSITSAQAVWARPCWCGTSRPDWHTMSPQRVSISIISIPITPPRLRDCCCCSSPRSCACMTARELPPIISRRSTARF